MMMNVYFAVVFFFQAEDGIRDIGVTGVQTCALPISLQQNAASLFDTINDLLESLARDCLGGDIKIKGRSEERRVGKECRSRRSRCGLREKSRRRRGNASKQRRQY